MYGCMNLGMGVMLVIMYFGEESRISCSMYVAQLDKGFSSSDTCITINQWKFRKTGRRAILKTKQEKDRAFGVADHSSTSGKTGLKVFR